MTDAEHSQTWRARWTRQPYWVFLPSILAIAAFVSVLFNIAGSNANFGVRGVAGAAGVIGVVIGFWLFFVWAIARDEARRTRER
jgi:uncharacterized membrane protein YhaH (DUF805 family)